MTRPSKEEKDYWDKILASEGLETILESDDTTAADDADDEDTDGLEPEEDSASADLPEDFRVDGGDKLIEDMDGLTIIETEKPSDEEDAA